MKALIKDGKRIAVLNVAQPELQADGDVRVQVMMAGLCRTDLYVAAGMLNTPERLVLGHEFSGIVAGSNADGYKSGDRVVVNPLLSCGHCRNCAKNAHGACGQAQFIGVDRNGCFAGYITVPATSLYAIPDSMPFLDAAYAEPVAASLAVLKAGIRPDEKGLIFGANRFSQLMQKILKVYGFENVDLYDPVVDAGGLDDSAYDYVIETLIDSKIFTEMVRIIRPGGKIILKSRQHEALTFKLADIIKKEPIFHVVNYGSFDEAITLLGSGKIAIDDLVDGIYPLEQFTPVFNGARGSEALKPFFAPWD